MLRGIGRAMFLAGVTVLALALSMTTNGSGSSAAATKQISLAFVPGQTTDPFYITMQRGASTEATKLGVKLLWQGAADWDVSAQTAVLDALLSQRPNALALVPDDASAMIPAVKKYREAGIPVIAVDTTISDASLLISQITDNSEAGGALAADAIGKAIHGVGEVAVIRTNPGVTVSDARHDGFVKRIKSGYPKIKIVADEYSHNQLTTAQSLTQSILLAHPQIVGIFGVNGNTVIGVAKGVVAAGKKGKVWVAGYDANPAEINLLRTGDIRFLVVQKPALEGQLAVDYAYYYLSGQKGKVPKIMLTSDIVATTDNMSSPSISKFFYISQ
jgi:ribose transport system substrate-binding protein